MVRELSVAKEPRQHRQRTRRQSLVDEWFLAIQCLDGRTTRQWIFTRFCVDDLWIQFTDSAQSRSLPSIARIQWLAENELAAGGIVAKIEPISCAVSGLRQRPRYDAARCSGVHAADQQVDGPVVDPVKGLLVEVSRLGPPPRSPKQVDAIDEDGCLALPDIGDREWLSHTVCLRDRVSIHHNDLKPR